MRASLDEFAVVEHADEIGIASLSITRLADPIAPIPLPAGAWVLMGGIAGIGAASSRRRRRSAE